VLRQVSGYPHATKPMTATIAVRLSSGVLGPAPFIRNLPRFQGFLSIRFT
jgi:hypothetical protein